MESIKEFLVFVLSDRKISDRGINIKAIYEMGDSKGYTKKELKQARKELGITSRTYEDGQFWRLPTEGRS